MKKAILISLLLSLSFSGSALAVGGRQMMNVVVKSYKPYFEVCFITTDLNSEEYCATVEGNGINWVSHTYSSHKTYYWQIESEKPATLSRSCKALGFQKDDRSGHDFSLKQRTAYSWYQFTYMLKQRDGKPVVYCNEKARG